MKDIKFINALNIFSTDYISFVVKFIVLFLSTKNYSSLFVYALIGYQKENIFTRNANKNVLWMLLIRSFHMIRELNVILR